MTQSSNSQTTNILYDNALNAAIVSHANSTGAHSVDTVPMPNSTYEYYHIVAEDLAKHVVESGKLAANNTNPHAENAKTATNLALITAHGQGLPVTELLQVPENYQKLIDICIAQQQLPHYELKDALITAIRPWAIKTQASATLPSPSMAL